jgi:hypothetical protein
VSVTAGCSYLKSLIRLKGGAPLSPDEAQSIAHTIVMEQGKTWTSAYQTDRITVLRPMTVSSSWRTIVTVPSFLVIDVTGMPA